MQHIRGRLPGICAFLRFGWIGRQCLAPLPPSLSPIKPLSHLFLSTNIPKLMPHSTTIATCSNYLCPGTLACVDKPTHCPCAFPDVEEKFELDPSGLAVCLSRSVWPAGMVGATAKNVKRGPSYTARKVDLARRGLI